MIKPYYEQDGQTIYLGDCREILPQLTEKFDLCLTDPPYGIRVSEKNCAANRDDGRSAVRESWDLAVFDNIEAIKRLANNYVIWGGNYYNCFDKLGGAIVWDKLQPLPDSSQCEIAAISKYRKVFKYEERWTNFVNSKTSDHPTEKPVSLMKFCATLYNGNSILDPFMGSGTTLVAAKQLGRRAVGIEIEEKYCEIAVKRLSQQELFTPRHPSDPMPAVSSPSGTLFDLGSQ